MSFYVRHYNFHNTYYSQCLFHTWFLELLQSSCQDPLIIVTSVVGHGRYPVPGNLGIVGNLIGP